jgi:hypothetical protein
MGVAQKNLALAADGAMQRISRQTGVPIRIVPTVLNADAYDSGDVLFDFTEITDAIDQAGGAGMIDKIVIYDKGDQAAAAWVLYLSPAVTALGVLDSAPNISDANAIGAAAGEGIETFDVASTDFKDAGGIKVATLRDLKWTKKAATDSRKLFLAATVTGTPTQATGDIVIDVWMA